jgi:hypothetical protein
MKKVFLLISLAFGLTYLSCEKNTEYQSKSIEAQVLNINSDCGVYQIRFLNNLDKVIELCGKSVIDGVYIAGNLPDSLKVEGLKIILNIQKPSSGQIGFCTTMGPSLNWVWIIYAKPK